MRLGAALRAMGGSMRGTDWGMGGSQELSEWKISCAEGILILTAETYFGLQVAGPRDLVLRAKELYHGMACR
ncbi:MAG TPA: hypothetical protein VEY92_02910 [Pseudoxanthomonas sp.]|nr:hypothetical protein [Pseudoxanthomonas sp.]